MSDRLGLSPGQMIDWEFQVERQGFISRYGTAGGLFFKQTVLQPTSKIFPYPIKRIDRRVYKTALSLSKVIE